MKWKKYFYRFLKFFLLIYIIVGAAFYFFQDKLLLHPTPLAANEDYHFAEKFSQINIQYDSTTSFNVVKFFPANDSLRKGVVLYFHGNKENINHYEPFAKNFTKNGYEVWMPDYPGFGKSTGTLNENIMYEEAMQVYKMARVQFAKDSIIIYGKSLGTGIAAYLASRRDCKKLILETPYYNIVSLAQHYFFMYPVEWFIHYKIPQNEFLENVISLVTIFHGTDDGIIPYSNAIKLKALLKPGDEFITIEGGSHNDLDDFPLFHQKLDSLLK
jgi:pimeloyl-ACP methyl ester carboxylesterase